MEFSKKYRHIGYSYVGVPEGWKPVVEKAIIEIEKEMWVRWLPMRVKRWIHYLATGNSVYYIKFRWANKLRKKLTGGQMITDIKEKYATLRIYCFANEKINEIIDKAVKECDETCQSCGSKEDVQDTDTSWIYHLCKNCRENKNGKN